jgi:hypothetical protein
LTRHATSAYDPHPGEIPAKGEAVGWTRGRKGEVAESISSKPLARSEDLVVEELEDGLLVYDLTSDHAHSLSAAAARVWRACDGKKSVAALGDELELDGQTIAHALEELRGCDLLEGGPALSAGMTRRDMTKKAVKVGGAAAAAPLIVSLAVPMPAAAQTVSPLFCTTGGQSSDCGISCMSRSCCCCCQGLMNEPHLSDNPPGLKPDVCSGTSNDKCCLPTTQCDAGAFGAGGHCSDTAACP